MKAEDAGMDRLGVSFDTVIGARVEKCGFDVWERDERMKPEGSDGFDSPTGAQACNAYLRDKGYEFANAGRGGRPP